MTEQRTAARLADAIHDAEDRLRYATPILTGDVVTLARYLATVKAGERKAMGLRLLDRAATAESRRRLTGRQHPKWGSGSLEAAVNAHALNFHVEIPALRADAEWARLMSETWLIVAEWLAVEEKRQ